MGILNKFYTLVSSSEEQGKLVFKIELNSFHSIYKGHFPGNPITPGVCELEIVKDCICRTLNRQLYFSYISSCKFISPINPVEQNKLSVLISILDNGNNTYSIKAEVVNEDDTFLKIKALMVDKLCAIPLVTEKNRIVDSNVVVVIPTYNNDATLLKVVEGVKRFCRHIIVVNDGSTDDTASILNKIEDIQVLTYSPNKGKGYALKKGLTEAISQGFRYAITIDSDGQHFSEDIPLFLSEIKKTPDSLLVGSRNLTVENMPGKNTFANKFSNFWFKLETGITLEDTQSGYRLYPLKVINSMKYCTSKYEFELEMLVFSAWKGVQVRNIPIQIYYPPVEERVSHFRPLPDFVRISILNAFLVLIAFFWFWPCRFFRKLTWGNIRQFVDKGIIHSQESNKKITLSTMLGVFMGIVPIWGYQMIAAVSLAYLFKLNKVITLIASNISIPPFMPFILYGSYLTGCIITGNPVDYTLSEISLSNLSVVLLQYVVGSVVFAFFSSLIIGVIMAFTLSLFRRKKQGVN